MAHPMQFLYFQLLGRLSYVDLSSTHTVAGVAGTSASSQVGVFLGAGFEGFIPAWRNVSLEASSGFNIMMTGISSTGNPGANDTSVFLGASNTNTFVPFNLAVHYYFL